MHNQLFTFRRCPYAIRARVALYVCDIVYEAIEVDLKHKPKKLLELSPKATVPVFVTSSGAVIDESLYIVEYALSQKLPEGFVNVTTKQYERGEAMLDALHRVFIPALNKVKYPNRYEGVVLQDEWSQLNQCLQQWEQNLHFLNLKLCVLLVRRVYSCAFKNLQHVFSICCQSRLLI